MSTSQTPNYGLHQWAGEDQFKRTDFNEDNAKLDAALHGLRSDVDGKAQQAAFDALSATVSKKANQTSLDALTTKVNAKAEQSALNALTSTVNTKASQSDLTALTTKVNAKAEQSALNALTTKVNAKAEQSALNALSATVSGKGNCRIVTGSYTGTGTCGERNPNTLTFDRQPAAVILSGEGRVAVLMPPGGLIRRSQGTDIYYWETTWTATSLSWYVSILTSAAGSDRTPHAQSQFNSSGEVYRYILLFPA